MPPFLLGGSGKDYDSRKSNQTAVNLILEHDPQGDFRSARRTPGLTSIITSLDDNVRSNFAFSPETNLSRTGLTSARKVIYFVAGQYLYEFSNDQDINQVNQIGLIGGGGPCSVRVNDDLEVQVSNGVGEVYNYSIGGTLTKVSDNDNFLIPVVDITVFNTRFLMPQKNQNTFFLSARNDGTTFSSLSRGNAEQQNDPLVGARAVKTNAWIIGTKSCELWQTFDDVDLPMRPVLGATIMHGCLSYGSIADLDEHIAFLTDDGDVILITGSGWKKIGDLELKLRIKGNGTTAYPGFTQPADCYGFFIDDPISPQYVLTFPTDNYTWVYNLATNLPHRLTSGDEYWRARSCIRLNNKLIVGDDTAGNLWELDPQVFKQGTNTQKALIVSPSYSFDTDVFVDYIEIDMEVGKITDSTEPLLMVRYSKDGGNTWFTHSPISLGKVGQYSKAVIIRDIGRIPRRKEFVLELSTTANCFVAFYGGYWNPEPSI